MIQRPSRRKRALARIGSLMLSAALVAVAVVGSPFSPAAPVRAATAVTYPDAISNISLRSSDGADGQIVQWSVVRITADWSVPDGARAGETFGMTLPQEFSMYGSGTFDILRVGSTEVMARCVVSQGDGPEVVCTLTDAVEGKENVGGSFWMQARATASTEESSVQFIVDGQLVAVPLPGGGGIAPGGQPTAPEEPYKVGQRGDSDDRIRWSVTIPGSLVHSAAERGAPLLVDQLGPGHHYTGELSMVRYLVQDGNIVGGGERIDPGYYSVA